MHKGTERVTCKKACVKKKICVNKKTCTEMDKDVNMRKHAPEDNVKSFVISNK